MLLVAGLVSAAGSTALAAPTARHPICVALVLDARSVGGGVTTGCAKVTAGATGVDVLQAEGHRLTFRSDGLLCTIDGVPSTGCSAVDDTHFWAYFHRAPGSTSWSFSNEGPSTYQPVNDSTEGWVYDNGTKLTPKSVRYDAICPPEAPPSSPRPTPTALPGRVPSHRPHPLGSPRPTRSSARPTPIGPRTPRHSHRHRHRTSTPAPVPSFSGSPRVRPTLHLAGGGGGGSGGLTGAIVAAVIVAAIAGGTVLTSRRRRSRQP